MIAEPHTHRQCLLEILRVFTKIGAMSYGGAAVIGVLSVSLAQITPHAAPDAFTTLLMSLTVAAILAWKWLPLPLMLAGAAIGVTARLRLIQRLREVL